MMEYRSPNRLHLLPNASEQPRSRLCRLRVFAFNAEVTKHPGTENALEEHQVAAPAEIGIE
jgi:hypothetical protein